MTSLQPTPDQQPTGLTGTEQAVVDTLTTALLEGSLVAGTAIPLYLLLRLIGAGSNRQAARAAIRLGLSEPVGRKAGPKVAGTAIGQVRAAEPQLRALYIFNAAKRITEAMGHGATLFTAVRAEQRFFDQHRQAARNRRRAARQVDHVAASSPFLYWKTADDARVEADCRHLSGTLFTVADPPKLNGRVVWPGTVHPHCLIGSTRVTAPPAVRGATVRDYVGDVVVIRTALGHELTGTPNHPIATRGGWVPLGELSKGDHVVSSLGSEWKSSGVDPDVGHVPPRIEEIAQAFPVVLGPMPLAPEDFHGDGAGSDVYVVRTDRLLVDDGASSTSQQVSEGQLSGGDVDVSAPLDAPRTIGLLLGADRASAHGVMRGLRQAGSLLWRRLRHPRVHASAAVPGLDVSAQQDATGGRTSDSERIAQGLLALASDVSGDKGALVDHNSMRSTLDPSLGELPNQGPAADAEGFPERLLALTAEVALDQIVHVDRRSYSGHVYNLETSDGWYIGNGIVTHNCRCTAAPFGSSPLRALPTITATR